MEHSKLSETARRLLETRTCLCYISAIFAFEIGQKYAREKLKLPFPPAMWFQRACQAYDLTPLPISPLHAFTATALPLHHRDPFDCLPVATAQVENLTLVTPDPSIHLYTEITIAW